MLRCLTSLQMSAICGTGYTLALPNTSEDVQSSAGAMAVSSASASSGSGEKVLLDLNSAVYPLYSSLQSRLATFSKWPAANFRPPEVLAPMGFFYAGEQKVLSVKIHALQELMSNVLQGLNKGG